MERRTAILVAGLVFLFLGFQFNAIQSFTLSPNATRFVQSRLAALQGQAEPEPPAAPQYPYTSYSEPEAPTSAQPLDYYVPGYRRVVTPPEWVKYVFFSLGAIFTAQGLLSSRG